MTGVASVELQHPRLDHLSSLQNRNTSKLKSCEQCPPPPPPRKKETKKYFTSNIPTLALQGLWGWALQGDSGVGHFRECLGLGTPVKTPGSLWGWALSGVSGWALQGLWGWALQESLGWALQRVSGVGVGVGHSRSFLGVSGVGHSRESLGVDRARRRVPGEEES